MAPQQTTFGHRTAVVTGGGGSLARAIILGLRDRGCRVVAVDRDADALAAFSREEGVATAVCDLLDADATERCAAEVWRAHGPVSILVNAVGLIHSAPLLNIAARAERRHSLETWRRVIDLNLTTVFLATVHFVEHMVSTRTRGVVINFSSVAAAGNAGQGAYSAAKAGVNALTRSWAKELGMLGIRFVASPRHADMLLVTGPVSKHMAIALQRTYDATPEPKLVVAVGDCGCSGGIFGEGYASLGRVANVIPVDVEVPGCPPPPRALLAGILAAITARTAESAPAPKTEIP